MSRTRKTCRRTARRAVVRAWRGLVRARLRNLPGHCRGPSDLRQALSAFSRAIRCHRRLAKLARSFFDSAVVDREARERLERRRWMETWEPILEKVYGARAVSERPADIMDDGPSLPGPRTQCAVERALAGWQFWLAAGELALARHRRHRPHAIPSFGQLSRLIEIGIGFGRLACGMDSSLSASPAPSEGPNFEEDLARAYGHR